MRAQVLVASLLVAVLGGPLLGSRPARADDTPARLAGFDALARNGKAVKLRAKLEGKGMVGVYSSVEGEFVDFWITGEPAKDKAGMQVLEKEKFIGSGKTDSNGFGEVEWTPEAGAAPGGYEVEARVRKGSKYVAVPATLDVLIAASDRPITLVSIEETLTTMGWTTFMRKDAKDIPANEGAAAALTSLAEKHSVIYMTGIEELSLVKTKDWLKLKSFPRGPVFFWNISTNALSGEKYKTQLVSRLRADFSGLTSGVGGQVEDANACIANNVTAYLVASKDAKAPADSIGVKSWDKLAAAVERQHAVEKLLGELAAPDVAKQESAARALAKVETGELGYLHRFLKASDVQLAGAARLVLGRVRARDAFSSSLDSSSDSTALASLIAAWRAGDATVTARLYRDGAAGLEKSGPALDKFRGIEVVNRSEPGPGKVVYRLRFLSEKDGAASSEKDYAFIRGDDGSWRVDAGDL